MNSDVYVHVETRYSDGIGNDDWRPSVFIQKGGKKNLDWMGRRRCDLAFKACRGRWFLHRVAAFVWGNLPPPNRLTWDEFNEKEGPGPKKVYTWEADHLDGDCMFVLYDRCQIVTPSENKRRQAERVDIKDQYLADPDWDKLPQRKKTKKLRTLKDLYDKYVAPNA